VVVVVVVVVNRERDAAPGASAMTTEDMRALQLETVKNSLEEYKQRSHDLRDENEALKREREEREGEARQIISFLRQDAERKDELIESLRNTIDQQRDMFQREREKDNLTAAKKLKEAEESFTAREKQLDNEMRLMQRELQTLQDFKERKASLEAGLDQEKRERLELEENHKEAIAQMERKFFEEKGKLQREAKQMLAEIKKSSQEEAVERLDASTKKILFENRRMAEELRLQVQETDDLQKLNRKREEENKRLRREVELNEQQLKEYAKQGFRSTREIRDLTAKVKSLEKSLGQVVKDYERKIQMASESHERRTKELELESQGLRQLLKLKSKELANVKRLAQLILEKRNEVETFLLESIDEVKVSCDTCGSRARARTSLHRAPAAPHGRVRCEPAPTRARAGPDSKRASADGEGGLPADRPPAHHALRAQGGVQPASRYRGACGYRRPHVARPRARAAPALRQDQQQRTHAADGTALARSAGRGASGGGDGGGRVRLEERRAGRRRHLCHNGWRRTRPRRRRWHQGPKFPRSRSAPCLMRRLRMCGVQLH